MTSISASSSSNYQSPLQLLQAELQSEVNSGAVSSTDQSALSSALTDINSCAAGRRQQRFFKHRQCKQHHQQFSGRHSVEDQHPDRQRSVEW